MDNIKIGELYRRINTQRMFIIPLRKRIDAKQLEYDVYHFSFGGIVCFTASYIEHQYEMVRTGK